VTYQSEKPLSVSYSGASTLQECERKFCFKYIARLEKDTDYVSPDYFAIGNAFHKVLELTAHDPKRFSEVNFEGIVKSFGIDPMDDGGRIAAMLRKYWILHIELGLKVVGTETKFEGTYTNGVIDATMVELGDKSPEFNNRHGLSGIRGAWWIVDLKTSGSLDNALPSRLQNDPQLNLYAAFRNVVAEKFQLDTALFAGIRYREALKPKHKYKSGEKFADWTSRCAEGVSVREIVVPASKMDIQKSYDNFSSVISRAHELQREFHTEKKLVGRCNYKACMAYARPCEWYSKCYGTNYTESQTSTLINSVQDTELVAKGSLFAESSRALESFEKCLKTSAPTTEIDSLLSEFSETPNPDEFC
jgi:hypothetical protein